MRPSLTTLLRGGYSGELRADRSTRIEGRRISATPFRILDAPGVVDDFYLNLLDWVGETLVLGLRDSLYVYNVETRAVSEAHVCEGGYVSGVGGSEERICFGESSGHVRVYDRIRGVVVAEKKMHGTRVGALALNESVLTTGDKEGVVANCDVRTMKRTSLFESHTGEICSLRWSPNRELLVSGSNDNSIKIWKMGSPLCRSLLGHSSAVRALDWCPWKANVLCTGGGSRDKTLRVWDAVGARQLRQIQTDSQVCSLHYLSNYREILTSHGFQKNDLKLWSATGGIRMTKSFGEHDARVLHTAVGPDQTVVVSLGADESLKFWQIGEEKKEKTRRCSLQIR